MKEEETNVNKGHELTVHDNTDKGRDKIIAEMAIAGLCSNASVLVNYGNSMYGELSIADCISTLKESTQKVHNGNLRDLETLLTAQANTLNTIFCTLASRAQANLGQYIDAADKYLKLALKAQSQCRTTIEAIAEIKNPKPYIQNNRAQYQQVNNTGLELGTPRAEKLNLTNELLEDKTHEYQRMDAGAAQATSRNDQDLAALGA